MNACAVPPLFTDLYQLTMLQAYHAEGMAQTAVFELFVRRLPPARNFLIACGVAEVLDYLEQLAFTASDLAYLETLQCFQPEFLDWLRTLRFTGNVYALPEGTPFFPNEPMLVIEAPLPEAQLVETAVLNLIHYPTLVASKGVRVMEAASGRRVVDFGARRTHGVDAALACARALAIVGYAGTSNLDAGRRLGIPVVGTMAHSYIQSHRSEEEAFIRFAQRYPGTTLLVDTYDTLEGVRRVIALSRRLGEGFQVGAIRLDSGDLATLARESRRLLDAAGLAQVRIVASGNLDEYRVAALCRAGAPIDSFGVGTLVDVVADGPSLEVAYKLVAYAGKDCGKLSPEKLSLPGPKQVYRRFEKGRAVGDVIVRRDEVAEGAPLLHCVMREGHRLPMIADDLATAQQHLKTALAQLPPDLRALDVSATPYPVTVSAALTAAQTRLQRAHGKLP